MRDYFVNIYSMKLENLDKMDKILDIYGYPKPNQQNINYLNRSIT
jgi:hypothetical protein